MDTSLLQLRIGHYRASTRRTLDLFWVELIAIVLVTLYAVIIFASLSISAAVSDPDDDMENDSTYEDWENVFHTLDQIFLSIFLAEIALRLFGFGVNYLCSVVNAIDAAVVIASFVLVMLPREDVENVKWLKLLRILRLLRFATVVNKLHRSRESAALRRKQVMYRRMGQPAEKVLDFLEDLRSRLANKKDQDNVSWMLHVIASDELYKMGDIDYSAENEGGADMRRWLSDETGIRHQAATEGSQAHMSPAIKTRRDSNTVPARGTLEYFSDVSPTNCKRHSSSISGSNGNLNACNTQINAMLSPAASGSWPDFALQDKRLANVLQALRSTELNGGRLWGFDVFAYQQVCIEARGAVEPNPAALLTYFLLDQYGVIGSLGIQQAPLLDWLCQVEMGYGDSNPCVSTAVHKP